MDAEERAESRVDILPKQEMFTLGSVMDHETVKSYYNSARVVKHYAEAAVQVGLWESEEKILTRVFQRDQSLLELGCGAGRVAMGLWELGYRNILATDFSRELLSEARRMSQILAYGIHWKYEDATRLRFESGIFDGAIFAFNGIMQIPGRENRKRAMKEIFRVLKSGAYFVFTSHDRELSRYRSFWDKERKLWKRGKQNPELLEFGDRYEPTPLGQLFIHVPTRRDVREDLTEAGFRVEVDVLRSQVADESARVREFSDECRFWIARKPGADQ